MDCADSAIWEDIFQMQQWGNEEWLHGNKNKAKSIWKVHKQVKERFMRHRKMYPYVF